VIFVETLLAGAYTIEVEPEADNRGFFARIWDGHAFAERGLEAHVSQSSISYNHVAGTLRGLHFQVAPHCETKLVRCIRGAIWDVIVDLRPRSPTFLEWFAVELTAENRRALYVPEEFAHGYQTLVDATEVWYQMSARYAPDAARGLRWDDPRLAIEWPEVERRTLSERDLAWPDVEAALARGG
jgi:dTDP-4-dehydrorhamnose 3,5-epimerase